MKASIQVCLSNGLLHLDQLEDKLVVFIDILRNTSVMTTALYHGVEKVKPVSSLEEASSYLGKENFIVAGERNAIKIPEFDFGNSPYDYIDNSHTKGKTLVITSTNGTQSVAKAKAAAKLICGGFVNHDVMCDYLLKENMPVLLLASGWKHQVNIEDTLSCGAIINRLKDHFEVKGDPALIADLLYQQVKSDIPAAIGKSSHYYRIASQSQKRDVDFCLKFNATPVVPVYDGEFLRLN